jgi:spore cortex biosynthesis protein YabQ
MDYLPYSQEYMLIVSIMGGMLLGFIWDIYRLFRHYIKLGIFGTAIGDIIYWIISVYFSIMTIYEISYGNVRLFILLGFLAGAIIYFYGASNYILKFFIFIIDSIIFLMKKFISYIIEPIKFIIRKIKNILYPFKLKAEKERDNVRRKYKFFKFRIKKVLKNKKMLYNKKNTRKKRRRKKRHHNI